MIRPQSAEDIVKDVIDLFREIDVNGDGEVEWEELTSYSVEAGVVATRSVRQQHMHRYSPAPGYIDTTSRGHGLRDIRYVPWQDEVWVVEQDTSRIRAYSASLAHRCVSPCSITPQLRYRRAEG